MTRQALFEARIKLEQVFDTLNELWSDISWRICEHCIALEPHLTFRKCGGSMADEYIDPLHVNYDPVSDVFTVPVYVTEEDYSTAKQFRSLIREIILPGNVLDKKDV